MSYNSEYKGSEVESLLGLIPNKQDKVMKFEDVVASNWMTDSTYSDYPYRCDISCTGVTENMYAEVVFAVAQAISGEYSPVCETKENVVSVWSKSDNPVTIPVIVITK